MSSGTWRWLRRLRRWRSRRAGGRGWRRPASRTATACCASWSPSPWRISAEPAHRLRPERSSVDVGRVHQLQPIQVDHPGPRRLPPAVRPNAAATPWWVCCRSGKLPLQRRHALALRRSARHVMPSPVVPDAWPARSDARLVDVRTHRPSTSSAVSGAQQARLLVSVCQRLRVAVARSSAPGGHPARPAQAEPRGAYRAVRHASRPMHQQREHVGGAHHHHRGELQQRGAVAHAQTVGEPDQPLSSSAPARVRSVRRQSAGRRWSDCRARLPVRIPAAPARNR